MTTDEILPLQQALIDLLKQNGTLKSPEVVEAFLRVPRHRFLPGEPPARAYEDIAIQVRAGPDGRWTSSSSQPSIMAIMLEQLALRPGMRVLEIGAGTGYNAALMAAMVGPEGSVTAVDIQPDLIEDARAHIRQAGLGEMLANLRLVAGDGGYGWPENAPYDRIILTASSATITPAWREQLAEGGRIVLPLDLGGAQVSTAFEKRRGEHGDELVSLSVFSCGFMPLQGGFAQMPSFHELAPGFGLNCPSQLGGESLDMPALMGWLARPGEGLPLGLRLRADDVWSGLITWLSVRMPYRACSIGAEEKPLAAYRPPLPALQSSLIRFKAGEDTMHIWLLLPATGGAALVRRLSPAGEPAADDDFDLEALPLGGGLETALELAESLRAWDAAGRPSSAHLRIRAVDAETGAQPGPGEVLIPRPWTNFMVGYRQ